MELAVELPIDLGAYPASGWDVVGEHMGRGWRKYEDDRKEDEGWSDSSNMPASQLMHMAETRDRLIRGTSLGLSAHSAAMEDKVKYQV